MGFPASMSYQRLEIHGEAIVVVFDICSSTDILEQLTSRGEQERFNELITAMKHHLAFTQGALEFDPYKFIGDGWILLFTRHTDGQRLMDFLAGLCVTFDWEYRSRVAPYLDRAPGRMGLTFGIDSVRFSEPGSWASMSTTVAPS